MQVPDWGRRAIRLSMSLLFFTSMSVTMWLLPKKLRAEYADEFVQSCNWAGATCAVVAASPLLGKVVQLSYERTLGTITGGLLGYLVYDYGILYLPPLWDKILLCCAAACVGALSCFLSDRFKLDASMRLFVITFLLVTFGAHPAEGAAAVALLRTGGIVLGVLVFMTMSVVVLPKSASMEALRELRKGLKLLVDLNDMVWAAPPHPCKASESASGRFDQTPLTRKASHAALCPVHHHNSDTTTSSNQPPGGGAAGAPGAGEASMVDLVEAGLGPNTPYGTKAAGCPVCTAHETKCEKVLTDVYQSTFKVKDHVGLAVNEAYVWHFWGHYFFVPVLFKNIPLLPWCWRALLGQKDEGARWAAIQSDTAEVATCIRRMARLLWMLHLDYTESFNDGILAQLRAAYPPHLSRSSLAEALGFALKELLQDFPDYTHIVIDPFEEFNRLVDEMLDISNAQRRSLLQRLAAPPKPYRPKRTFYRTQSVIGPPDVFVTHRPSPAAAAGTADGRSPTLSSPSRQAVINMSPTAAADNSLRQPLLLPQAGSDAAAVGSTFERPTHLLSAVSIRDSRLASGRAPLTPYHAALIQQQQQQAAARAAGEQAGPGAAMPAQQHRGFAVPNTDQTATANSAAGMPGGGDERRPGGSSPAGGSPPPSLLSQALRVSDSGGGAPPAAAMLVPATTAAPAGGPGRGGAPAPAAAAAVAGSAPAAFWPSPFAPDGSLQGSPGPWVVGEEEQPQQHLLFPATEQGVAAEVRWYSFQFLVDEIAEELEELYLAASTLLNRLPYHAKAAAAPGAAH